MIYLPSTFNEYVFQWQINNGPKSNVELSFLNKTLSIIILTFCVKDLLFYHFDSPSTLATLVPLKVERMVRKNVMVIGVTLYRTRFACNSRNVFDRSNEYNFTRYPCTLASRCGCFNPNDFEASPVSIRRFMLMRFHCLT